MILWPEPDRLVYAERVTFPAARDCRIQFHRCSTRTVVYSVQFLLGVQGMTRVHNVLIYNVYILFVSMDY